MQKFFGFPERFSPVKIEHAKIHTKSLIMAVFPFSENLYLEYQRRAESLKKNELNLEYKYLKK